jgi:anti-sigma regulatory factor (Ser/Thr protein kinase)
MAPVVDLREDCATRWDGTSEHTLAQSLAAPAIACIEAGLVVDEAASGAEDNDQNRLDLAVSIQSIYRQPIARAFVGAIGDRLGLDQELRDRILTVLHEALLNAVLHGHLRLEAGLRDTLGGVEASHELIKKRLASPDHSQSKVVIKARWSADRLLIAVHDNGIGFEPRKSRPEHRGSGRGLLILEAFCDSVSYQDCGRMVVLGFEL